uniref:ORF202 protein n=1 Tax=Turritis glabra TaxID=63678 RepID=A0A5H2V798_TURGL|nr:ORF202 protein [Turritis glabra]
MELFSPRAAELTNLFESQIRNFYANFQVDEIGGLFMLLTLGFLLILILVFVLWILVRALWHFPLAVIHMMVNSSTLASSSSSSSSSNNKIRDKRKKKEDLIRNLVVEEVDKYLATHRESIIEEFPGAFPLIETTAFLTKVSTDLLRSAGLPDTADPASMEILHKVHRNFVDSFEMVKEEGYRNNILYDSIRCFLKHYRSRSD